MHRSRLRAFFALVIPAAAFLGLAVCPRAAAAGAAAGLKLCLETVIPGLFPFFVLSSAASGAGLTGVLGGVFAPVMRPLFGLPGVCAPALLFGLTGGYPAGARAAAQLYRSGACSREEAEALLAFCNNTGPALFLGYVGAGIWESGRAGLVLYAVHAVTAILTGILLRPRHLRSAGARPKAPQPRASLPDALTGAVSDAMSAILGVCGYVILFSSLAALLPARERVGNPAALLRGALEMTGGLSLVDPGSGRFGAAAASAILAWGGLSVQFQTRSVLADTDLSMKKAVLGKALHALLAAGTACLIWPLIPLPAETASVFGTASAVQNAGNSVLLLPAAFLLSLFPAKRAGKPKRKEV